MSQEVLVNIIAIPLIIGLVQVAKNTGLPDRFAPLGSLVSGLILMFLYGLSQGVEAPAYFELGVIGLVQGLSAAGLYSGVQTIRHGATLLREDEAKNVDVVTVPKGTVERIMSQPVGLEKPEDVL